MKLFLPKIGYYKNKNVLYHSHYGFLSIASQTMLYKTQDIKQLYELTIDKECLESLLYNV